jgi:uncharacterized tellurite resistance protein B-like protein
MDPITTKAASETIDAAGNLVKNVGEAKKLSAEATAIKSDSRRKSLEQAGKAINLLQENALKMANKGLKFTKSTGIFGIVESIVQDVHKNLETEDNYTYIKNEDNYDSIDIGDDWELERKISALRSELSKNISEIEGKVQDQKNVDTLSVTKMIFTLWTERTSKILKVDNDVDKKLDSINTLFTSNIKNFRDYYKFLKPVFGISAAMSIVYAVMLLTGTGMGILFAGSTFLMGIPVAQIGGIVGLATVLLMLSKISFSDKAKVQSATNMAYYVLKNLQKKEQKVKKEEDEFENKLAAIDKRVDIGDVGGALFLIVALAKHLMKADGKISLSEKKELTKYLENNFALNKKQTNKVFDEVPDIEDLDSAMAELANILPNDELSNLFDALKKIALADGVFDNSEAEVLSKVLPYLEEDKNLNKE